MISGDASQIGERLRKQQERIRRMREEARREAPRTVASMAFAFSCDTCGRSVLAPHTPAFLRNALPTEKICTCKVATYTPSLPTHFAKRR